MSKVKIYGISTSKVPWQDKPAGHKGAPVWRYTENPIIGRNPAEGVARIFNSAVMPYGDEFIGVFRGEQVNGVPYIYLDRRYLLYYVVPGLLRCFHWYGQNYGFQNLYQN